MTHAVIIDDQQSNIKVLGMLLEQEGVTYSQTTDPNRLEHILAGSGQIDVVFLDLEFPTADGLDLLSVLRSYPALSGVPIIAYTVHTSEINQMRNGGFDGFLGKPLNAPDFPENLRRILSGEAVWVI
jgi:CheY-like chemotaxis protein